VIGIPARGQARRGSVAVLAMGTLPLLLGYLGMAAAGLVRSLPGFAAAALWTCLADAAAQQFAPSSTRLLSRFGLVPAVRSLLRDCMLLMVLVGLGHGDDPLLPAAVAATAIVLTQLCQVLYRALQTVVKVRGMPALTGRNLPLPTAVPVPRRPKWLGGTRVRGITAISVLVTAGGLATALSGRNVPVVAGSCLAVGFSLVSLLRTVPHLLRVRRMPGAAALVRTAARSLAEYRPEVVLYHHADQAVRSLYQVEMWLETVARLDRRAVVVLRDREALAELAPTTLPVLCVPRAADLEALDLSGVRVVLYPGNAAKNAHMLRLGSAKHVFIGHGDSDKNASSNRFSKVYDEIWVAGPAGRKRYADLSSAIRDTDIVEVGRPQLSGVQPVGLRPPGDPLTVLYAPTWEGWSEDGNAALAAMGERIVRLLLDCRPAVRILYKPHPLTGARLAGFARADRRIRGLLLEHGGTTAAPDLAAEPPTRHLIAAADGPPLYDCFNRADLLITDISSVVSDFLASGKPYSVTNPGGLPEHEFGEHFPTAAAAYLLDPSCTVLAEAVDAARTPRDDRLADRRRRLRAHLLGPDSPDAMTRFNDAVNRLAGRGTPAAARPEAPSADTPAHRAVHAAPPPGPQWVSSVNPVHTDRQ
jgi:hypothetical protein